MPSFVILTEQKTAVLCSPNAIGEPDRKSALPIHATIRTNDIQIVGEARPGRIIAASGRNGKIIYCVEGSTIYSKNKERRQALDKARTNLLSLVKQIQPLAAETGEGNKVRRFGLDAMSWWYQFLAGVAERSRW